MSFFGRFVLVLWCCTCAQAHVASAQTPQSSSFQLQQFRPWGDPEGGLQTQSAKSLGQWGYLLSATFNLAKDPLILRTRDNQRVADVVRYQLGADIALALGLLSFLDLQLRVPATLYQDASAPGEAGLSQDVRLSGFLFSDIQVGAKAQFLRQEQHALSLGLQLFMGIPTNSAGSFNGEESVSFGAMLLLSRRLSVVQLSLNLGYHYGPRSTLGNLVFEHGLSYSLSANVDVVRDRLSLIADVVGRASFGGEATNAPLEVYAGGRIFPLRTPSLALTVGGAVGVVPGAGAPLFRVLLGIAWSPRKRGVAIVDTDGDGIVDALDRCPRVAGPKPNKGCPWVDSDGDGVFDNEDRCPRVAGPKPNKGCPWVDSDGDGLRDNLDRCPKKPGPARNKGCPVLDRDRDGIVDKEDKCPDVPGTRSRRGCPKLVLVYVTQKQIRILQKIHFATGSAKIRPRSFPILEQVAAVLLAQRHLRVRVEGHTDNVGEVKSNLLLSQRRASAVRLYLIGRGISLGRLLSAGFGMSRPIAPNHTAAGRQSNRRVEFHILPAQTQ